MLPGFRFLFAAIVLSMSVLVFGLGAAAFLRAAHEQFAGTPSWHAPPEAGFTLQTEAQRPVLSMLRVEEPAPAGQPSDIAAPANAVAVPELADPAAITPSSSELESGELEKVAALAQQPDIILPATSERPVSDGPAGETTLAHDAVLVAQTPSVVTTDPANEIAPAAPEAATAAPTESAPLKLKIARLDSPSVAVDPKPAAKAVNSALDTSAIRKRQRARRIALRRRLAAERARQQQTAPQAAALEAAQQVANPSAPLFAQPMPLLPRAARDPRSSVRVHQNRGAVRPSSGSFSLLEQTQAEPVATGGPSGSPHSAHDPSYSAVPRTPSR